MRAWTVAVLLGSLCVTGCGGGVATVGASGGASMASARDPLPVIPMRLVRDGGSDDDEALLELSADGTFVAARGRFHGRIDHGKIIAENGDVLATVLADGQIVFDGRQGARFDANDTLVGEHDRVVVGDDGVPTIYSGREVMRFPAHFVPFSRATRRTAALLALIALEAAWDRGMPS